MTPTEEFETLFKAAVNAKQLSRSKTDKLSEIAMKNMEHDTQLVSILYRTHKSLSSVASKISSLYIFDALARAAKSHAMKKNLSGDIYTLPGNAATFLLKIGGVVEGLFQDMVATASTEAKEKSKKIYDIWVKGNTFPTTILARLSEILNKGDEVATGPKATPPIAAPTTDPRILPQGAPTPPVIPSIPTELAQTQTPPILNSQAALLALLTQAAASSTPAHAPQLATNGIGGGQLDAAQLTVLQQLAHTAASVPSVPQFLTLADSVNVQKYPSSGFNGSSLSPPEHRRSETNYSGYRSPEHESRINPHDGDNMRGRYRGGFRGRGRGDRLGRDFDNRDHRYRDSERDGRIPPRASRGGGRSRSRSPARNGHGRTTGFGSPHRRPREVSPPSSRLRDSSTGKDEFGRDIRIDSDSPRSPVVTQKPPPHSSASPPASNATKDPHKPPTPAVLTSTHRSTPDDNSVTPLPLDSNKNSSTASATPVKDTVTAEPGLENFNLAAFDYTSPASWEALGKLWQVTNGSLPSQEHLMQFVMACMAGQQPIASGLQPSKQEFHQHATPAQSFRGRGTGRRGGSQFRGRGGSVYGNDRSMQENWGYEDGLQSTDAIILGGGSSLDSGEYVAAPNGGGKGSLELDENTAPTAGRMQKVGDKWMFVRGTTEGVS